MGLRVRSQAMSGNREKALFIFMLAAWTFLATVNTSRASVIWEGHDWGGADFAPANGDILSGRFANIGRFMINEGDTVYAGSPIVSFFSREILIDGSFLGGAALSPSLEIKAAENITLGGTLEQWWTISLASLGGSISLLEGSMISVPGPSSLNGSRGLPLRDPGIPSKRPPGDFTVIDTGGSIAISSQGNTSSGHVPPGGLLITGGNLVIRGKGGGIVVTEEGSLESGGIVLLNNVSGLSTPLPPSLTLFVTGLGATWLFGRSRRRGRR